MEHWVFARDIWASVLEILMHPVPAWSLLLFVALFAAKMLDDT